MGKPILYGFDTSPPVRACLLTAKALDLDLEYKQLNIYAGENKSAEYLKKNPQHTIPTLEDGGEYITDSHAIITYLVEKYAKTDSLYPKDLVKRAHVDQRLHFDSGVLFPAIKNLAAPMSTGQPVSEEITASVHRAYEFLELFLASSSYVIGESLTVADFSCLTSISILDLLLPVAEDKYPKLKGWYTRLQELPYYYEVNGKGIEMAKEMIKNFASK